MHSPTTSESSVKKRVFHAGDVSPLRQCHRLSIVSYQAIVSLVVCLLFLSRPIAVAWFIVAVVVSPFYAVLFTWAMAHVGQEIDEQHPSLTYGYSSASITVPVLVILVGASLNHVAPDSVLWRISFPVRPEIVSALLFAETSTASGIACCQITFWNGLLVSAVAATNPQWCAFRGSGLLDNDKFSEAFSGKIDILTWHGNPLVQGCRVRREAVHQLAA